MKLTQREDGADKNGMRMLENLTNTRTPKERPLLAAELLIAALSGVKSETELTQNENHWT